MSDEIKKKNRQGWLSEKASYDEEPGKISLKGKLPRGNDLMEYFFDIVLRTIHDDKEKGKVLVEFARFIRTNPTDKEIAEFISQKKKEMNYIP